MHQSSNALSVPPSGKGSAPASPSRFPWQRSDPNPQTTLSQLRDRSPFLYCQIWGFTSDDLLKPILSPSRDRAEKSPRLWQLFLKKSPSSSFSHAILPTASGSSILTRLKWQERHPPPDLGKMGWVGLSLDLLVRTLTLQNSHPLLTYLYIWLLCVKDVNVLTQVTAIICLANQYIGIRGWGGRGASISPLTLGAWHL